MNKEYPLLDRLIMVEGNWKVDELLEIKQELHNQYAEERDVLLRDGISYIDAFMAIGTDDFEAAYRLASPIRSRLMKKEEAWNLYEIAFASVIASFSAVLMEIEDFVNKTLTQVKEFSKKDKKRAESLKISMCMNVCSSLLYMKYFKEFDIDDSDDMEKIFSDNIATALSSSAKELNIRKYCGSLIIKGLFFEMKNFIDEGLNELRTRREEEAYQFMLKEIDKYKFKYEEAV